MKKKVAYGNKILDKLHRGIVWACIGVTICGTFALGERAWYFLTVTRPQRKKAELEMLEEGAHDKAKDLQC